MPTYHVQQTWRAKGPKTVVSHDLENPPQPPKIEFAEDCCKSNSILKLEHFLAKFPHSPIHHYTSIYGALLFSVSPVRCACIIKYGAVRKFFPFFRALCPMWLQRERKDDVIWSDLKLGGHLELNAILFQSWSKLRSRSRLTSFIGSNILRSSSHTTLWYLQVKHQHLKTNLQGSRLICTSWFPVNQISNFKFSGFFRVLFVLWSLKYPHQRGQQTPRVSTELEILVYLSFSFIPLQKVL